MQQDQNSRRRRRGGAAAMLALGLASSALWACTGEVVMPGPGGLVADHGACDEPLASDRVSLPRDDAAHADPVEWWYWTGHLESDDGRRFGFELVFFVGQIGALRGLMVHHALTDVAGGDFDYRSGTGLFGGTQPADGFALALAGQTAVGGDGQDVLHAELPGSVLDLQLTETKRPVLQHGQGYLDYAWGGYTYYYSRPRMRAEGDLTVDAETLHVRGDAWFDHQWGDLQSTADGGWDWFALQLDDDREIMIYHIRQGAETLMLAASVQDAWCGVVEYGAEDLVITPVGQWQSPATGCTYPMGWQVAVGDEVFDVTPVQSGQELAATYPYTYWEGAATVAGAASGRAYVELVGYCGDSH